jgi:hypothetical protein
MLETLKFVRGAVATKDFQPALTHFRIKDGRVMGYNGTIALSSPIALDVNASPKAVPFVKAIERCQNATTVVHMTPAGRISLKSGKFKVIIECCEESEVMDAIVPEGEMMPTPATFVETLKLLDRFVCTDATPDRRWSNGILLRGQSAYATSNIVIVEKWLGQQLPFEVNIPGPAVKEILRIGLEPVGIQIGERSITMHYPGERWLRAQMWDVQWPDLSVYLDQSGEFEPFPPELFDAAETLKPFYDIEGRLFFRGDRVSTSADEGAGGSIEMSGVPLRGAFHHVHLLSLKGVADTIDFTKRPAPFRGNLLRGVILPMHDE